MARVKRSIDRGKFDIKAELSAEIAFGMGKKVSSVCSIILIELYRIFFGSSDNCFSSGRFPPPHENLFPSSETFVCSPMPLPELNARERIISFELFREIFLPPLTIKRDIERERRSLVLTRTRLQPRVYSKRKAPPSPYIYIYIFPVLSANDPKKQFLSKDAQGYCRN